MEALAKEIGLRIRRYRLDRHLTQEALAERAEVHQTYIGQVERGEKNVTITSLARILCALDITLSDFFENMEGFRHPDSIPMQCDRLIRDKSPKEQAHIYRILLELDQLLQP